jgi:hypothetical protein
LPVDDSNASASELDGASLFKDPGGLGYGGATRAEHVGKEFLGEIEDVGFDAILHHEEPASKAFFGEMQAVAGGDLAQAGVLALDEFEQAAPNSRGLCEEIG